MPWSRIPDEPKIALFRPIADIQLDQPVLVSSEKPKATIAVKAYWFTFLPHELYFGYAALKDRIRGVECAIIFDVVQAQRGLALAIAPSIVVAPTPRGIVLKINVRGAVAGLLAVKFLREPPLTDDIAQTAAGCYCFPKKPIAVAKLETSAAQPR